MYATNASGAWAVQDVDTGPFVGIYNALALDSAGAAHISYYDAINGDLKYAANATGSWVLATLDNLGNVGLYTSIAIDASDKVHISYHDYDAEDLKYATTQ